MVVRFASSTHHGFRTLRGRRTNVSTDRFRVVARPARRFCRAFLSLARKSRRLSLLSRYIADSAIGKPDWAARISKAKPAERAKLASPVLLDPALLRRLSIPFEDTPYMVSNVSFEKVLFGRADQYSSNGKAGAVMVPFDAQLWLRLAPRN